MPDQTGIGGPAFLDGYAFDERYVDEMFAAPGRARTHCEALL